MVAMFAVLVFCLVFSALLLSQRWRNRAPSPAVGAEGVLEANLESFLSHLEVDLDPVRAMAPRFALAFTDIALTVLVLEYVLRDQGVVRGGDLQDALRTALLIVARHRGELRSMPTVGHA
jgi:hypothetical protein